MKPNRHVNREFGLALDALHALIDITHEAIEKHRRANDPAAITKLIERQRRNLKLLLHKLEKERGDGK